MHFTDLFIRRPVLATVVSLLILVLGLRSANLLPVREYPHIENAVVTVTTVYTGADPSLSSLMCIFTRGSDFCCGLLFPFSSI